MEELYQTNDNIKEYVDKYCQKHHISINEAFNHEMVAEYVRWVLWTELWERKE